MAVVLAYRVAIYLGAGAGARYVWTARGAGAPGPWAAIGAMWGRLMDGNALDFELSEELSDALGYPAHVATYDPPYELRKLTCVYTRNMATGVPQDSAMTTHHFINITGDAPDATWTTTDYETVEEAFFTMWSAIAAGMPTEVNLNAFRWTPDGPAFKPHGAGDRPTVRVSGVSGSGTGAPGTSLPPQIAISVTEVTGATFTFTNEDGVQSRNRWGRFYLPGGITGNVVDGRLGAAYAEDIADAVDTFYETCGAAELYPVMYSPTTGGAWLVTDIHVDDIYDVIRSRRFDGPLNRNSRHIAATD